MYKINKVLFICGLFLNTLACSTYQSIETESHNKIDLSENRIVLDTLNLSCELRFIQVDSDKKLFFPNGKVRPTLKISNGKYRGFGVCNTFYGEYIKKKNVIKFKSFMTTYVGCMQPYSDLESMRGYEIESLINRFLGQVNYYDVDKDKLILKQDSEILMIYKII